MSTPIARYFASMSIQVDRKSVLAVDNTLKRLENKLRNFGKLTNKSLKINFNLNNFKVDNKKLNTMLGNALDQASMKLTFEIRNFSVNQRNMQAAVMRASRNVSRSTQMPTMAPQGRQVVTQTQAAPRSVASHSSANYLHAGGATGAFMRYGPQSLPLIGGVYGVGALNRANQELVSTEIAAGAIFGDKADQAKGWLEKHSDYVGYNYLETMPVFSSFMASSMPLMGYDQSQAVFESLAEFGRTRGADSVGMKRAMTAIQQMASKGQVMQEELKLQLSEAKGFGESRAVFAEANQMRKGGTKTGAEAAKELLDDMQRGEVMAADILPLVAKLYKELAKGGIEEARKSSVAQQARFQNERTRGLRVFSESGGEEGFARAWGTIAEMMKSAQPLIKALAGTFEDLTKTLQAPAYLFDRMTQTLSILSQTTGIAEKNFTNLAMVGGLMMTKWGRVGIMFSTMLIVLEDIAMGVSGEGDSFTGRFIKWMEESGVVMGPFEKGLFGVSAGMLAIATALKAISAATSLPGVPDLFNPTKDKNGKMGGSKWGRTLLPLLAAVGAPALVVGATGFGVNELLDPRISARNTVAERWDDPMSPLYQNRELQLQAQNDIRDPSSSFYNNLPLFEQMMSQRGQQETLQKMLENQAKGTTPLPGITPMSTTVQAGAIVINTAATDAEGIARELEPHIKKIFDVSNQQSYGAALLMYPQKE